MKNASNTTVRALQLTDTFKTEREADEAVLALAKQDGFMAGRSIRPTPQKPGWRVQAFLEDHSQKSDPLPDGVRRVLLLPSLLAQLCKKG